MGDPDPVVFLENELMYGRVVSATASKTFFSTSSSSLSYIPAGFAKIKEKQKWFNIDNGKRVHERGGAKDDIMYNLTLLIIIIGGVEWCRVVYKLAFPSKG